jgi:riboflavin biosynthesis pyrimidine reductase
MTAPAAFAAWSAARSRDAAAARIERLTTIVDASAGAAGPGIGNAWSRLHFGGDFRLVAPKPGGSAVTLVFVQTKDGNTAGADPEAFGGGATDKHLIYEGLSRVAADAVLAGAGSLHADAFFSVWHPEVVALRLSLGLPRHPAQVIVSKRGRFDVDALVFNVPDVPVFLVAGGACVARHAAALRARPWIRLVPANADGDLRAALDELRAGAGIRRISAIGGRSTATRLGRQRPGPGHLPHDDVARRRPTRHPVVYGRLSAAPVGADREGVVRRGIAGGLRSHVDRVIPGQAPWSVFIGVSLARPVTSAVTACARRSSRLRGGSQ